MKKFLTLFLFFISFVSFSQTNIINTDFSNGIPSDWFTGANNPQQTTCPPWTLNNTQNFASLPSEMSGGIAFATTYNGGGNPSPCNSTGNYLQTPYFNGSSYSTITLTFDHYFTPWQPNTDIGEVIYTTNGQNWTTLATYNIQTDGNNITFNLTPGPNMSVSFEHTGYDGDFWAIDNVEIVGTTSGGGNFDANFSANPVSAAIGETISFSDLSIGNISQWSWDFGDGGSSSIQNPTHSYSAAGVYDVSLTVSNNNGSMQDTETKTAYITVSGPDVSADFEANLTEVNIGDFVTFTDLSTGNPTNWDWRFWTGDLSWQYETDNVQNPTFSWSDAGVYKVELTASNSSSSDTETKIDYITVIDPCVSSEEVFLTNIAFTSSVDEAGSIWESYFIDLPTSLSKPNNNPENLLNPNSTVSFKIQCKNERVNGQAIVGGSCEIITNDPYLTVVDGSAGLNNVGWNSTAWSTDEFTVAIGDAPNGYLADLDFKVVEGNNTYYTRCISIPVRPLIISNMDIDDDSNPDSDGDNDDICEPGETIEIFPYVDNVSLLQAELVAGTVVSPSPNINVWDNQPGISGIVSSSSFWNVAFGSAQPISPGEIGMNPEFDFVFDYNASIVTQLPIDIVFTGGFRLFDVNGSVEQALIRFSSDWWLNSAATINDIKSNDLEIAYIENNIFNVNITGNKIPKEIYVTSIDGKNIFSEKLTQTNKTINLSNLATGLYVLGVKFEDKIIFEKIFVK